MIKKIDHVNICVADLETVTDFFVNLIGFKITAQGLLEGKWMDCVVALKDVKARYVQLSLDEGSSRLELIQYENPKGEKDPKMSLANQIGFRHMAFEVENIDEVVEKLKKAGVKFHSEIQNYKTKRLCYFLGPEGIILEFAQY